MYSYKRELCPKVSKAFGQHPDTRYSQFEIFVDVPPIFHLQIGLYFPALSSQSPPCGVACYNTISGIASYYSSLSLGISEGIYPDKASIILSAFLDDNCLKIKSQYSSSFIPKKCPIDVDNALQLNTDNTCL